MNTCTNCHGPLPRGYLLVTSEKCEPLPSTVEHMVKAMDDENPDPDWEPEEGDAGPGWRWTGEFQTLVYCKPQCVVDHAG